MVAAVACSTELFVVGVDPGGEIDPDPVHVGVQEVGFVLSEIDPGVLELRGAAAANNTG